MPRPSPVLAITLLAATVWISGCNVLDPAYQEGGSVQLLLEDARYARTNGDFERAVQLLEEAYDLEPTNPVVRLELAGSLLQRDELNSISIVAQIADHVQGGMEGVPTDEGQREGLCSWAHDGEVRSFDPAALISYSDVVTARSTLNRVRDLFASAEASVMPNAVRELNVCNIVRGGTISYDRDALLDEMYDAFDGDYNLVRTALMLNSVTLTLDSYVELFASSEVPVSWFLVGEPESAQLGFCTDPVAAPAFADHVAYEADRVGRALVSIDLLVHDANHDGLARLRDDAIEFYSRFEDTLEPICG